MRIFISEIAPGSLPFTSIKAFIAVDPESFTDLASKVTGDAVDRGNIDSLLKALENRNAVKVAIEVLGKVEKESKSNLYGRVGFVKLMLDPLTSENGLLTPTWVHVFFLVDMQSDLTLHRL